MQLQEVCLFPRPNDRTLVSKLNSTHAKFVWCPCLPVSSRRHWCLVFNPLFRKNPAFGQAEKRLEANHFVVFHAPGSVAYCVDGFVVKNKECAPSVRCHVPLFVLRFLHTCMSMLLHYQPFLDLLDSSSWPALRSLCPRPHGSCRSDSQVTLPCFCLFLDPLRLLSELSPSSFALAVHRQELGKLTDDLKSTHSHFIRCLRPNATRQPRFAHLGLRCVTLLCTTVCMSSVSLNQRTLPVSLLT